MTSDLSVTIAFGVLILAFLSLYWTRFVYETAPRRDVILRFFANLWRVSEEAKDDEVDNSEFFNAVNEAKLLFAKDENVIRTINQLASAEPENHESLIKQLAEDLATASKFNIKHSPKDLIAKPIYW